MTEALSQEVLEAAYCWEPEDGVPGRPAMTAFRRRLRYAQAQWREANGHPIGSQPIVPRKGKPSRPAGSRLPLDYARETGASFLTAAALEAARARTTFVEPHQSFDHQRLWAELLWSATLAFNLFGDLAADLELADRAVHTWWPDAPGTVSEMAIPLLDGGEAIGAIDFQSEHKGAFDLDDVAVGETLAEFVAVALRNARQLADGNRHNHDSIPMTLAGQLGGLVVTDRQVDYPGVTGGGGGGLGPGAGADYSKVKTFGDFYITLASLFGVKLASFGNDGKEAIQWHR